MKYFRILFSAAALLLAASCIDNDVPYPVVELRIAGVEGSGFTVSGISIANRTVALTLDEKTDIRKVGIDKVTFDVATSNPMMTDTESFIGQIKTSRPLSGEFDLRSPLYVTLSLYQDYEWTIVAEQPIERAFTVAGQIGATVIDAQKRTATAYVAKGTNLGDITVTRLKLGPADITTYSPTAEELSASGFETMRFVDATYHGTTERWTLHVEHTDLKVAFRETDLWNNTGVITAMVTEEEYPNAVIQYRVKGTDEWQATQKGERDGRCHPRMDELDQRRRATRQTSGADQGRLCGSDLRVAAARQRRSDRNVRIHRPRGRRHTRRQHGKSGAFVLHTRESECGILGQRQQRLR